MKTHPSEALKTGRRAMLLSAGYGKGHHSAAQALAEELSRRGWRVVTLDACAEAKPRTFRLTQRFYRFCVQRMPRLWGVVYRMLDTVDWAQLVHAPGIAAGLRELRARLLQEKPDLVVCTYPLYAYMLDALARTGEFRAPYAIVVTDALAISRAWVLPKAPLICLPDAYSLATVSERYAPAPERLAATGFPVRAAFTPGERPIPGPRGEGLHIVYGAHASTARMQADVKALLQAWPNMAITIPAEDRAGTLRRSLAPYSAQVRVCGSEQSMAELLHTAHFYIGKAGGATMFEAYAARVPLLINYALPGQEEGNLRLLQRDGAGCYVGSARELQHTLAALLADSAAGWRRMCAAMATAARTGGAARTVDELERRFFA